MRHILTFKTTFPESSEYDHPRGWSICKFLETELSRAKFNVQSLDNYRDIGWSIDCYINSKRLFVIVGYLGTKVTDWQLIICSSIGIFGRIFGQKDENERMTLAKSIHHILSKDNRFSELRWYSRYTDSPKDKWYSEPTEMQGTSANH